MTVPKWILDPYEGQEPDVHDDLTSSFKERLNAALLEPVDESDTSAQKRIEAKASYEALIAAFKMPKTSDSYVIYALNNLVDSGLWKYLDAEYDTFSEFCERMYEEAYKANPKGSSTADWRFIVGWDDAGGYHHEGLLKILQNNGYPLVKAVTALSYGKKWREAIPRLRMIEKVYYNDPQKAADEIKKIIDEEILNPEISARDMRKKPINPPQNIIQPISAQATGRIISTPDGGGMVTIRVDNEEQAKAVERALSPIVEKPDEAFYPRDGVAVARETREMLKKPAYQVRYEPMSVEEIAQEVNQDNQIKVVVPIVLDKQKEDFLNLVERLATGYSSFPPHVVDWEVYGYMGKEVHILATIDVAGFFDGGNA